MRKLQGRVALVTGAGRGIGRAVSVAMAKEGAIVAVASRSQAELDDVVSEISSAGGTAAAFISDLSDRSVSRMLVSRVQEQFGSVEILANNAGVGSSSNPKPVQDLEDDFWDLTLEVNLTAPFLLSQAVLPDMLASKWGRIITVASINGRLGSFHGAAYAASKHGVLGLMRTLALETAGTGITVNSICPGPVKSLMNDKRIEYDANRLGRDLAEHEKSLTPIGGRLVPEDIAPMAVYLAAEEARMITGQAYNIDGGLVMS
jgi:NAD(P)-dependent dehydrogenase (short-subunit alcohol dehydrogenase family)